MGDSCFQNSVDILEFLIHLLGSFSCKAVFNSFGCLVISALDGFAMESGLFFYPKCDRIFLELSEFFSCCVTALFTFRDSFWNEEIVTVANLVCDDRRKVIPCAILRYDLFKDVLLFAEIGKLSDVGSIRFASNLFGFTRGGSLEILI